MELTQGTVHGDAARQNPVWLEVQQLAGKRVWPTIWPNGYTARFTPGLEIVDRTGHLVAREGSVLKRIQACDWVDGRLLINSFQGVTL